MSLVTELEYSNKALNVISAFYDVEVMMYVEGDDDIVFWESVLNVFEVITVKVSSVGGKEELSKYIGRITSGKIEAFAAKDLDFSILCKENLDDPKVLTTFGHSIENSFFCKNVIAKSIRSIGRLSASSIDENEISNWLEDLQNAFRELIIFDASNEINGKGLEILGNNCSRFMKDNQSHLVDTNKVQAYIKTHKLSEKLLVFQSDILAAISAVDRSIPDFMRGHFLFSAVVKFISNTIKHNNSKKTASYDAVFGTAVLAFESVLNASHPHYEHYSNETKKLTSKS